MKVYKNGRVFTQESGICMYVCMYVFARSLKVLLVLCNPVLTVYRSSVTKPLPRPSLSGGEDG